MDPIHLLPEELDYELDIRGVFNLSNSRQKTTCLREFLKREESGETTITRNRSELTNSTMELNRCGETLDSIIAAMQESNFCAKSRLDCRSRLIHVIDRIKRAKPASPEEQTVVYEMIRAADSQLGAFEKTCLDNPFRSHPSASPAKSTSPLADAIEIIRASQKETSLPISKPVESALNPSAKQFEPVPNGASNNNINQLEDISVDHAHRPSTRFSVARFSNLGGAGVGSTYGNVQAQSEVRSRRTVSVTSASEYESDREHPHNRRQLRQQQQHRRSVPVYQWKLAFSGDGQGLHLYDFLSELRMFQRAEGVSDAELFSSVVHLLVGRARLWYRSWFDTFRNWDEMVSAMKAEFLPPKYDYKLLTNISNRRQKSTETFAEYFTIMQSMFKHLSIPVNDQHKLCIIEENMLTKYSIATSVVEVTSLAQLSNICRRVDFAYSKSNISAPQDRIVEQRPPVRGYQGRFRDVHEVGAVHQDLECPNISEDRFHGDQVFPAQAHCPSQHIREGEILEMRRRNEAGGSRNEFSNYESRECFNCSQVGHSYTVCPEPRNGQFCFRCGSRDVTSFKCKNCAKNGDPGSARREGLPNPPKQ